MWIRPIVNDSARVSLPSGENFVAQRDENLLAAAQRAHWLIRYGCRNGNCEACAATLVSGQVLQCEEVVDASNEPQPILLCLAHPCSDLQIQLPGNPLHGSAEHARRGYAQLISQTVLADGSWELEFELPAGRQPPMYAGQFIAIESNPPLQAHIEVDVLNGRRLTVISAIAPALKNDERVFLRYPLGYAYRLDDAQPLWLLYEDATAKRALQLQAEFSAAQFINMSAAMSVTKLVWPQTDIPVSIYAFAESEPTIREWYTLLLAAGIPFTALRSDFVVLQPWRVCRQDDNGNRFTMREYLDESAARALSEDFSQRGHKQLYWAEPMSIHSGLLNK